MNAGVKVAGVAAVTERGVAGTVCWVCLLRPGHSWWPSSQWLRSRPRRRSSKQGRECRCHSSRAALMSVSPARRRGSASTATSWTRCRGLASRSGIIAATSQAYSCSSQTHDRLQPFPQLPSQVGVGAGGGLPGSGKVVGVSDGLFLLRGPVGQLQLPAGQLHEKTLVGKARISGRGGWPGLALSVSGRPWGRG
jgi:hypothetical protein